MNLDKRMSYSSRSCVKRTTAVLLAISLVFSVLAPTTIYSQGVPPVGPSG